MALDLTTEFKMDFFTSVTLVNCKLKLLNSFSLMRYRDPYRNFLIITSVNFSIGTQNEMQSAMSKNLDVAAENAKRLSERVEKLQ